jgi:hypothetical protein
MMIKAQCENVRCRIRDWSLPAKMAISGKMRIWTKHLFVAVSMGNTCKVQSASGVSHAITANTAGGVN